MNYPNKYRNTSLRLQDYDYRNDGAYFITICTHQCDCFFATVSQGIFHYTETGRIAQQCWQDIPLHFPFVHLGAWIIMPNHMHGIIIIKKPTEKICERALPVGALPVGALPVGALSVGALPVGALHATPQQVTNNPTQAQNQKNEPKQSINQYFSDISPKKYSLGSVIRSYKSAVTKNAREIDPSFAWQKNYYDRIIRNDDEYKRISAYIRNNPKNWKDDDLYK